MLELWKNMPDKGGYVCFYERPLEKGEITRIILEISRVCDKKKKKEL